MKRRVDLMAEDALAKDRVNNAGEWISRSALAEIGMAGAYLRAYVTGALAGRSARQPLTELVDEEVEERGTS